MSISVNTRTVRGLTVAEVGGRLSAGKAVTAFTEEVKSLVDDQNNKLVLDLSALEYLDSKGIEAIVSLYQKAESVGGGVRISRPNPKVKRLLDLTKLSELLGVIDDESAAVDSLLDRSS